MDELEPWQVQLRRDVGHSLLFPLEEGDSQVGAFVQITASTSAIVGLP